MKTFICTLIVLFSINQLMATENVRFEDEIVVNSEAVAKTATVNTITAEEIKKQGAKSVADALELIPGVFVRVGGKGESYVRIRGLRQREIAVLINGLPLASPYDGQIDLSNIPIDSIEKIEVVKGAASVMYGSNTMGGVINIITKKSDGSTKRSLSSEVSAGNSYELGTTLEGSINSLRYMVVASTFNKDYYPLSSDYEEELNQGTGNRLNSDRDGWQSMVTLGWDGTNNSRNSISIQTVNVEKGLPHHESDKKAKFWRFTDWETTGIDWIHEKNFNHLNIKSKLFYNTYKNTLDGYDDITYSTQDSKNAFTSSYDDSSYGGDVFAKYSVNKNSLLKFALRARKDNHKEQADIGELWENYTGSYLSLPFEYEYKTSFNWTIVAGISFDMMTIEEFNNVDSHNEWEMNPQLAVLIPLNDNLNFKTSYSKKTRFPTLKELFSTTSGNPELNSMKNTISEAGIEYIPFEGLNLSFVAYSNNVTDLIYRIQKNDPYQNIDKASFNGFETEVTWIAGRYFVINGSYAYLNAKDKSSNSGMYIEYRPKHQLDLFLDFLLPANTKLTISGYYISSQIYYNDDIEQSLEATTLLNLRLSKNFDKFELYAFIKNITDELYYESEGYPLEGRTWAVGLKCNF